MRKRHPVRGVFLFFKKIDKKGSPSKGLKREGQLSLFDELPFDGLVVLVLHVIVKAVADQLVVLLLGDVDESGLEGDASHLRPETNEPGHDAQREPCGPGDEDHLVLADGRDEPDARCDSFTIEQCLVDLQVPRCGLDVEVDDRVGGPQGVQAVRVGPELHRGRCGVGLDQLYGDLFDRVGLGRTLDVVHVRSFQF